MSTLLSRIQRELPDTDRDRYDVAYDRGRSQARSGLLLGGLAIGALAGAAAMFLFDPNRGDGRRAQLASRATGIKNDLARTASGRVEDLQNRAKGAAIETGIRKPGDEDKPARVADPLTPDELEEYGAAGPIAGAATAAATQDDERQH